VPQLSHINTPILATKKPSEVGTSLYDIFMISLLNLLMNNVDFFILPSPLLSSAEGMTGTDSIEGKFTDLHISFCSVAMPKQETIK
jgi:hypothetical protein